MRGWPPSHEADLAFDAVLLVEGEAADGRLRLFLDLRGKVVEDRGR